MKALSFGGGVQTTALITLIARKELLTPDVIAFSDTGCEWPETYDFLERYTKPLLRKLAIPFVTVRHAKPLMEYYRQYRAIPQAFQRSCTDNFKVRPLAKEFKKLGIIEEWIGFSEEEQGRAKRKTERPIRKNIIAKFPLIDLGLNRADCASEIERFGWPVPPKSACICCPFQHPSRIAELSRAHPDLFEQVAQMEDKAIERKPGYYISRLPWRQMAQPQMQFEGDWSYGCAEGYCLR